MSAGNPSSPRFLNRFAPALALVVDIGTVFSWIFGLVSAVALASQPAPLRLPGLSFQLGAGYQLFVLLCATLAYFQFLHALWRRASPKAAGETTFSGYFFNTFLRLRRPLAVLPVVLAGMLAVSILTSLTWWPVLLLFVILGLAFVPALLIPADSPVRQAFLSLDENRRNLWTKRIKTRLCKNGQVCTEDFAEAGIVLTERFREINWALQAYFDRYEFEQDLLLSPPEAAKTPAAAEYVRRVLSFRHAPH